MRGWPCARVGFFALVMSGSFAVCGVKAPPRPPLPEPAAVDAGASPDAGTGADSDAGTGADSPGGNDTPPAPAAPDGGAR